MDLATKLFRRRTDPTVFRTLEKMETLAQPGRLHHVAVDLWYIGYVNLVWSANRWLLTDPSTSHIDEKGRLVIHPSKVMDPIVVEKGAYLHIELPAHLQDRLPTMNGEKLAGHEPYIEAWRQAEGSMVAFRAVA